MKYMDLVKQARRAVGPRWKLPIIAVCVTKKGDRSVEYSCRLDDRCRRWYCGCCGEGNLGWEPRRRGACSNCGAHVSFVGRYPFEMALKEAKQSLVREEAYERMERLGPPPYPLLRHL